MDKSQAHTDVDLKAYLASQMQMQMSSQESGAELKLSELWKVIWSGKKTIVAITFFFSMASIVFSLSQPNIYKSSVLLAPVISDTGGGSLSGLAGQFGGLASLAGINLNSGNGDNTTLALEILKSRKFIQDFIDKYDLLVPVMAVENWDLKTNTLIIDEDIYDAEKLEWVREVKFPKKRIPTLWEAYEEFTKFLSVSQDKETGMVTLSVEYYSPYLAKQWAELLIVEINSTIKEQDNTEAQESIKYLEKQLAKTNVANMQAVFYQLIEEQSKNMMLTQIKKEYVLKTIDPAYVSEEKAKPSRGLIVVLGSMLGSLLAVIYVLIRYFTKEQLNSKPNQENFSIEVE